MSEELFQWCIDLVNKISKGERWLPLPLSLAWLTVFSNFFEVLVSTVPPEHACLLILPPTSIHLKLLNKICTPASMSCSNSLSLSQPAYPWRQWNIVCIYASPVVNYDSAYIDMHVVSSTHPSIINHQPGWNTCLPYLGIYTVSGKKGIPTDITRGSFFSRTQCINIFCTACVNVVFIIGLIFVYFFFTSDWVLKMVGHLVFWWPSAF